MSKRSRSLSTSPPQSQFPPNTWSRSSTTTPAPESSSLPAPESRSKLLHVQPDASSAVEVMRCSLPPHREALSFSSYADYEVHYRQAHVNRCVECGKNFPTERFLDLHIEENHDSLMAARRERGDKTYGCFIEDCDRRCATPQKRRMHLVDKHMFPRTYNFFIVNDGIDKQTSLLRPMNTSRTNRRRISNTPKPTSPKEGRLRNRQASVSSTVGLPQQGQTQQQMQTQTQTQTQTAAGPGKQSDDMDIVELEKSMSALKFVPASVVRNRGKNARS